MYYPQSEVIALLWLLLGLAGGGTWPALRQAIKVVDFEVFNLVFIPSAAPRGDPMRIAPVRRPRASAARVGRVS